MSKEPDEKPDETTGVASTPPASAVVPPAPGAAPTPPPRAAPPPPPPPPPPITGAVPRAAAPGTPPPPAPGAATIAAPAAPAAGRIPPANYNNMVAEIGAMRNLLSAASQETQDRLKDLEDQVKILENLDTAADVPVKDLKQRLDAPMKALQDAIAQDKSIDSATSKTLAIHTKNINEDFAKHSDLLLQQVNQMRTQHARDQLALAFGQGGGLPDTTPAIGGMQQSGVKSNEHFIDRLLRDGGTVKSQQAGKNFWTHAKSWLEVKVKPGGERVLKSNNPAVLAAAAKAAGYTSFEFTKGSPASILKSMKEFAKLGIATSISQERLSKFSAAQKEEFQKEMFKANYQDKYDSYQVISEGITKAHGSATLQEFADPNKFSSKVAEEMDPGLKHQARYARRLGETSGHEVPGWTQHSVAQWHDVVQPAATPAQKFDAAKDIDSGLLKDVVKSQTSYKAKPEEKAVALNALMNQVESGPDLQKELKSLLNNQKDRVPVVKALLAQQEVDPKFKLSKEQKSDLLTALSDSSHRDSKKATALVEKHLQEEMAKPSAPAPR